MDDAHLLTAIRYVELNPVKAGLVDRAERWRWSSARAHVAGAAHGLTDLAGTSGLHRDWRAMPRHGLEAGDIAEAEKAAIEARMRTGRPLGDQAFVEAIEQTTARTLKPQKRGPKVKRLG